MLLAAWPFKMFPMKLNIPNRLSALRAICASAIAVVLVVVLGCQDSDSEAQNSVSRSGQSTPESTAVELSFGTPTARLEIANPNRVEATLFRIDVDQRIEAKRLDPKETQYSFIVPSGFYLIQPKRAEEADSAQTEQPAIGYPAPAIANVLNSTALKIEIGLRPDPQPGWCWIPAGPAIVGDTLGVGASNERPARIENVAGFWLAETEVTNLQYAQFLSAQSKVEDNWIDLESKKCRVQKLGDNQFRSDAPELPVVMVSFHGAQAYCDWLTEKTKQTHRLPVEAEWEKAARGPESNIYAYGNVYQQSLANQESGKLKPVKSYRPNSYGLYDMTGNVFEWMSNQNDPNADRVYKQSLRGGSFVLDGMYLRNSFRMRQSQSVMTDDIGFRVAKDSKAN